MPVNQFTDGIMALRREVAALKDAAIKSASIVGTVSQTIRLNPTMTWDHGLVQSEVYEIRILATDEVNPPLVSLYFANTFDRRYWMARRFYYVDDDEPDNNRIAFRVEISFSANPEDYEGTGQRTVSLPLKIVATRLDSWEVIKIR